MLKRNIILIFGVLIAFMFFFTPESHASFTVNGETYPDLPTEFRTYGYNELIEYTSLDYFIVQPPASSGVPSVYMRVFLVNDAEVTTQAYMDGNTLTYTLSKKLTGDNFKWCEYVIDNDTWRLYGSGSVGSTARDKTTLSFTNPMTFKVSSKDIYTDSTLSTLFFQKTPISNFQLHQIVGETVQQEIPKMASKIIQAMKVIVVFSISCLIFFLLLATFSKVFSIFQVK